MGCPREPGSDEYFVAEHPPFRSLMVFFGQKSWGGMPRVQSAITRKEFDGLVDEYVTCGYEILDRSGSTTLLRKRTWGSPDVHLIWAFATFWTLGIGNLAYAFFSHINAEQVMVKLRPEHEGAQKTTDPAPPPSVSAGSGNGDETKGLDLIAKRYQPTSTSIRDNLVVVALSMMCCGPLGLFFVWTNPRWSKLQKGAWSLLMLPMLMIGSCIQEQKTQQVARSLVEGDKLWDAGSRDEAADRYRKAWKDHKEILTSSTDSTREAIRPHLPNLYARLMVYELSKGRRDEARQLSEQAIKDKIELTLETAEAIDFHKSHMPNTSVAKIHMPNSSVADAQSQGRGNGEAVVGVEGRSGQSDSTARLDKGGLFTDQSWNYKNDCQVIFEESVSSSEARKLGDYLLSHEFFDNDPVTFQVGKPGKTYEFRVVIKKGLERDREARDEMRQLGQEISRFVFGGAPVDVHLCDDQMKTIRVIVP